MVETSNFIFRPENYVVNSCKSSVSQDDIKQLKATALKAIDIQTDLLVKRESFK